MDTIADFASIQNSRSGLADNILGYLLRIADYDAALYNHSVNVAKLSLRIGIDLKLNNSCLKNLGIGALLHDIGKISLDKSVLFKRGKLSEIERKYIQEHPMIGYQSLNRDGDIPLVVRVAVLQHHERYNGSGYPMFFKEEKISLYARIIAVADMYDAMVTDRPYRKALKPELVREYIKNSSGTLLDPLVVDSFLGLVLELETNHVHKLYTG